MIDVQAAQLPDTPPPGLTESDLHEVIAAFNDVTVKLQSAHEALLKEVAQLKGELLLANEQLERSRRLAALGEMAAGIAHEIRNPLGSIRLYARMLEDDLADRPQERTTATKIAQASRTVDAVVQDVLAFAREVKVRSVDIDARDLLERALEEAIASDRAERKSGVPEVEARFRPDSPGEWPRVQGDPSLLHRAMVNILSNAIQAMREVGEPVPVLDIEACVTELGDAGGRLSAGTALRVVDCGPGVTAEVQERMFNPFFTTRAAGTGLGLAIVHRIVDAHGGRVVVKNRAELCGRYAGRGAVFEVQLPMNPAQAEPAQVRVRPMSAASLQV